MYVCVNMHSKPLLWMRLITNNRFVSVEYIPIGIQTLEVRIPL